MAKKLGHSALPDTHWICLTVRGEGAKGRRVMDGAESGAGFGVTGEG